MSVPSIDGVLVTRTQAGDEEATTELARPVRPLAQRYAGRFFSDPTRAEDLAQMAMMKAFARIGDVCSPEAFPAWLLRITRNECLNELARQRVAQVPISTLQDQGTTLEAPAGGEDDPEESFVRLQLQSLVREVITTLPSHYRRTLTMRALEDSTYEEISAELEVPVAVARLWYCRARKRFRQAFVDTIVARRNVPAACIAMGGDIAELIEGTLVSAERNRVEGHLAACDVCRQTEDELRSTAFRTPTRATLLGLGVLGFPPKVAQHAVGAHGWTGAPSQPAVAGMVAAPATGAVVHRVVQAATPVVASATSKLPGQVQAAAAQVQPAAGQLQTAGSSSVGTAQQTAAPATGSASAAPGQVGTPSAPALRRCQGRLRQSSPSSPTERQSELSASVRASTSPAR